MQDTHNTTNFPHFEEEHEEVEEGEWKHLFDYRQVVSSSFYMMISGLFSFQIFKGFSHKGFLPGYMKTMLATKSQAQVSSFDKKTIKFSIELIWLDSF